MKIVIALCLLSLASAQQLLAPVVAPVQAVPDIRSAPPIERTEFRDLANQFSESFSTRDGQVHTSQGVLKPNRDGSDYVLVQQGSYRYYSPEGTPFEVKYIADENGFQPSGDHIHTPRTQ